MVTSTPINQGKSSMKPSIRDGFKRFPAGWAWETDSSGKVLWCSSELRRLLGYHPEELIGKNLITLADTPQSSMALQRAIASGQPLFNLKVTGREVAGRPITLLFNAIPRKTGTPPQSGYRGVTQVLGYQEPLEVEAEFKQPSAKEFEQLTSSIESQGKWEIPSGYMVQNGQIQPIETPEQPEIPPQPEISDGRLTVPILGQQDTVLGVVEFERHSEEPPWTEDDKELVTSISRQLALAIQDIRSYQLTQQALDEMRKVDQLKTEFLANVSHELRTPLNSIIGFSRVILKGLDGPVTDTQKQDLNAIYNAGQHLLGLINNILDISKIESGKMDLVFSEVDLSEIIESVMDTVTGLVKGQPIQLTRNVPESLPMVWGNSIRIRQVLLNLLSNAAKFTDEGTIGISAKISEDTEKREIVLSVSDTGRGISAEDQNKIFEPFSQVDSSPTKLHSGTGLGLSICRHLVELHGGRIWVESIPGEGSTFSFTLPLMAPPLVEEVPEGMPIFLAAYTDHAQLNFLKGLVQEAHFAFVPLSDLTEIVPKAIEVQPKVILIDPTLPEGLGWKAMLQVKREPQVRTIPTKIVSTLDEFKVGFDLGIGEIATKPLLKECLESAATFLLPEDTQDKSILVIEDDQNSLEWIHNLIQLTLSRKVRTASSGFEGLVATRQQLPDLVILNLFMANADGFRMVEALRVDDRTRNMPLILLFPQELSDAQIRQLRLWTDHCRKTATTSTHFIFQRIFDRLSDH
jgi:signal transduction histidine kinase/DNA-binding response OmpR family regulator